MSTVPPSHIAGLELRAAQRFDLAGGLLATISPFGNTLIVYEMPNRTTVAVRGAFTLPGSPYRIRLQDGRAYVAWIQQTPIDREGLSVFETSTPAPLWATDLDAEKVVSFEDFTVEDDTVYMVGVGAAILTYASRPALVVNVVFPLSLAVSGTAAVASYAFRRPRKPAADPHPSESSR